MCLLSPSSVIWYWPRSSWFFAGKVTAGRVESNDSLPLGLWLIHLWLNGKRAGSAPSPILILSIRLVYHVIMWSLVTLLQSFCWEHQHTDRLCSFVNSSNKRKQCTLRSLVFPRFRLDVNSALNICTKYKISICCNAAAVLCIVYLLRKPQLHLDWWTCSDHDHWRNPAAVSEL